MQKVISDAVEKLNSDLKRTFEHITTLSLTLDIWTDRKTRGYLGVTAHYIDLSNSLQSSVLAVKRFIGKILYLFFYKID